MSPHHKYFGLVTVIEKRETCILRVEQWKPNSLQPSALCVTASKQCHTAEQRLPLHSCHLSLHTYEPCTLYVHRYVIKMLQMYVFHLTSRKIHCNELLTSQKRDNTAGKAP